MSKLFENNPSQLPPQYKSWFAFYKETMKILNGVGKLVNDDAVVQVEYMENNESPKATVTLLKYDLSYIKVKAFEELEKVMPTFESLEAARNHMYRFMPVGDELEWVNPMLKILYTVKR